jgi:hypothetical protein
VCDIWKPKNSANLPAEDYRMLELGDTLASHASFIASLNLQDKYQSEMKDAMAKYIKKNNLEDVRMSNTLKRLVLVDGTCCWPMRQGTMDLFRMLGKTDGSHWRHVLKSSSPRPYRAE